MAKIDAKIYNLGITIVRFNLPMEFVDDINKAYDENSEDLKPHNDKLAGKIQEEKKINEILTPSMNNTFKWCFEEYLKIIGKPNWNLDLSIAWINEMKSGEYNPTHFHEGLNSEIGLSSVLMLKRPDWYGVEASREERPANGWLGFSGGDQAPLSISQIRVDAQVGEFYVFPYTLLHEVYPFNSTDEVRRTLSYNCDLTRGK
tara:strand:- start:15 stop:620 length:606 start_codon:yes stop_codon:yes gene_type:complete